MESLRQWVLGEYEDGWRIRSGRSQADVVLPTKLLGVDPSASTTILSEIHMGIVRPLVDDAGDLVINVGSGSYSFVLSAA